VKRLLAQVLWRLLWLGVGLANRLMGTALRRGGTTIRLGVYRDGWWGRHATRFGPGGEREYLCLGAPLLRLEVWRPSRTRGKHEAHR
jgi:hypothetical protein